MPEAAVAAGAGAAGVTPAEPSLPLRSIVRRTLPLLVAAALIVALASLALSGARWTLGGASQVWPAARFGVVSGNAQPDNDRLIVRQPGPNGSFIATLPSAQIDAADYSAVEIRVRGLAPEQKVAVFWRNRFGSQRTFSLQANLVNDETLRAQVRKDPNWTGPIAGLGIVIVGSMRRPVIVESVRAVTASVTGIARETVRDWFDYERWNGQSINVVFLGAETEPLSLPLFVGTAVVVALAIWSLLTRRRSHATLLAGALVIAGTGWLLLDARWMVNLAQQARETAQIYGGKSWHDKRLAADDKQLFEFLEKAREAIAARPGRIFFTSDFAYFRARAGYHLLPLNALSIVYHRNLHEPETYRPGDYLCFFARSGLSFDPAQHLLSWDGKAPVRADVVTVEGFGSLYRVLG